MTVPNNNFKAVYNPFNRKLSILYGSCITTYFFEDMKEWTKVSFNGDNNHPNYLHIQLDYDEEMQLIVYSRVDGSDQLNEHLTESLHSNSMNECSKKIKVSYNDREFNEALSELEKELSRY